MKPATVMESPVKKILARLAAVVALLVAVLVINTLRLRPQSTAPLSAPLVAVDAGAAAARLGEAVRLRTVSLQAPATIDTDAFLALHAFLEQTFPGVHTTLQKEIVGGLSLLYTWPGRDASLPPVLLLAHQDVVPVDPGTEELWTLPAFSGEVRDGFVWGRGTLDDKGSLMAILEAVERLLADGFAPERTIYLAFGHDEEIGGEAGAAEIARVLEERGVRLAFVLDEGSVIVRDQLGIATPIALIGVAEKGYLSVELTLEVAGGHSSQPPRETAIGTLSRAIARLEANRPEARIEGATAALFESLGPHMPFGRRLAFANLWLFRPLVERILGGAPGTDALIRTTTAPTIIEAGVKENVLPIRARAVVNFRILPGETVASVLAHVEETIADPRIELRPLTRSEPPPISSRTSAAYELLARSIRETAPADVIVAPLLVIASTDSKHFTGVADDVYRFLPVTMGPDDLPRYHGTDERVATLDHARSIRFYARLLNNVQDL